MNFTWISVIISFFTSLIVSIFTFIFGLRAGKNQVDRPRLKDIYRGLSVHFEELYNKFLIGNPKRWKDFPENKNDRTYLPIVKKLKNEGNLIDINKILSQEMENLELKYLKFSSDFFLNLQTLLSESTNLLKKYSKNVVVETENKISSKNLEIGSSYFEKNLRYCQMLWMRNSTHPPKTHYAATSSANSPSTNFLFSSISSIN